MLEREVFGCYRYLQGRRYRSPQSRVGIVASRIGRALMSRLTSPGGPGLDRELFGSFHFLQRGRSKLLQFKLGAVASLLTHFLALVFALPIQFGLYADESDVRAGGGWGRPPGRVIEFATPPVVFPSPEAVVQLLGEATPDEPANPPFIAERSLAARGEPNPDPSGSSQLPRTGGESGGQGDELPGPGRSGSGGSDPSTGQTDRTSEASDAESATETASPARPARESRREVIESTTRLPTIADRTRERSGGKGTRGAELPAAGDEPDLTVLQGASRSTSTGIQNPESLITDPGPISVNARGVGAVEVYRAYLEETIQRHWRIPPEANLLRQPALLTVEFEVSRDGRLLAVRTYQSTGVRTLDRAAIRAIELASPFRPLPPVFANPSQLFTDTFVYYPPQSN